MVKRDHGTASNTVQCHDTCLQRYACRP